MLEPANILQLTRPHEARRALGHWLRLSRQRQDLTQGMLATRSGVPVATLSRLEREGAGGMESLMRALQALGELDRLHSFIQEQLRIASLPQDLSDLKKATPARQRVRPRKPRKGGP